jgi:acetyl-CoA acetyltransferase
VKNLWGNDFPFKAREEIIHEDAIGKRRIGIGECSMKDRLAVIGIGEIPTGWYPDNTCVGLAVEAIKEALLDAGIEKGDIGAVLFAPPLARERDEYHLSFCRLAEEMGVHGTAKVNMQVAGWWASPMMAVQTAKSLINHGDAETVVVLHAQNFSGCTKEDLWWFFERNNLGFHREWERHYGINYKSMVALITNRYMHETGTTPEQLASVAVGLRKWAMLNENSRFHEELHPEEILQSGIESEPLHTMECGNLSDGATAFILTSADRAEAIGKKPPVYILGEGHAGPPYLSFFQKPDKDLTRLGIGEAVRLALQEAGIQLGDVDVFELFAGYPVFYLMQLEEIGLCDRGEAGKFFLEGKAGPGGEIPISTNGGIQQGDSGLGIAMTSIIEGVRQLRGAAGGRQIQDAVTALITGFGNQMMDSHAFILGKELAHERI